MALSSHEEIVKVLSELQNVSCSFTLKVLLFCHITLTLQVKKYVYDLHIRT